MGALRIRLFGQVSVQRDGRPLPALSAKPLELLCYLLLHRDRGHTREALADLLWPGAPDPVSKKYLRQAIWQLHTALASRTRGEEPEPGALLTLRPGWVRINPEAAWWLDVAAFEQAFNLCRDTRGEDLTDAQGQALESAIVLYRGDLIEAWYQDWCLYDRDRLQQTYLAMLERMMGYCEARQLYATGIAYGQSILRHDPAQESAHRHLMRLHYLAGDRTSALRQYQRCVSALAKDFGLQPSRETDALYRQVRTDHLEDSGPSATPVRGGAEPRGDLLLGLQARLEQIQASVAALHRQVQQEMTVITNLMGAVDVRDIAAADSR
jgi:DNA-binding SARP family transcriptional activator